MPEIEKARWLRDLLRFLSLKPQFVLSGNVKDFQIVDLAGAVAPLPLLQTLATELIESGFKRVVAYDPVSGFRVVGKPGEVVDANLLNQLGLNHSNGIAPAGVELFSDVLSRIVTWPGEPIALIADFASRLAVRNDNLSQQEHLLFTRALVLSQQARTRPVGPQAKSFFNSVIWIVDKEGDVPDWLLVGNPRLRHIPISKPDARERSRFAPLILMGLSGFKDAIDDQKAEAVQKFVDETEGLLLVDMTAIVELGRAEGLTFSKIGDAVRRYKVGVTEDPWQRISHDKVKGAENFIRGRVKGQDQAVIHVLDIIKRAVTGVGNTRRGGRPRGIAFLAGPTGVGKTELAKTITSLLFGDESAYIRFDMSEFSAEHSDQRLIGAPPGYVGYDVGGELTNAVRDKPFSLVLFDEIEKAHPRILDKFLQVLDDGVLTSGRGDRVYFSEALVVFTSNLGIYKTDSDGTRFANVSQSDSFSEIQSKVRSEIENHFKIVLNRPELLNRIGDNLVVFDFIRTPVATEIFELMANSVAADLAQNQNIRLTFSKRALDELRRICLEDLSNGGRGIRNKVETHLINPLARAIFDQGIRSGKSIVVDQINIGTTTSIQLSHGPAL